MQDIFIVGCGDIGRRVAAKWQSQGASVTALVRSEASANALQGLGIKTVSGDLDRPETLHALPLAAKVVYYFAPPPRRSDRDPRMGHFLGAIAPDNLPRRIVYISTSGVYGDTRGEWVSEQSPVNPQTDRARRRLDAESALRRFG
ncbi:MAG: NAD(P)H-binding protein, partial [Pseudomonadota bacterium]